MGPLLSHEQINLFIKQYIPVNKKEAYKLPVSHDSFIQQSLELFSLFIDTKSIKSVLDFENPIEEKAYLRKLLFLSAEDFFTK